MNTDAIRTRKSVRTYKKQRIPDRIMEQVQAFLDQCDNPFGIPIAFAVLDADEDGVSSPVILGADSYSAGKYRKQKNAEVAFGYALSSVQLP